MQLWAIRSQTSEAKAAPSCRSRWRGPQDTVLLGQGSWAANKKLANK